MLFSQGLAESRSCLCVVQIYHSSCALWAVCPFLRGQQGQIPSIPGQLHQQSFSPVISLVPLVSVHKGFGFPTLEGRHVPAPGDGRALGNPRYVHQKAAADIADLSWRRHLNKITGSGGSSVPPVALPAAVTSQHLYHLSREPLIGGKGELRVFGLF